MHGSLIWFIKLYRKLVRWSASLQRLEQFEQAIAARRQQLFEAPEGRCLCTQGLTLCKPDGAVLREALDISVGQGEGVRLGGRSGLGKSTLLRTLQGLWPYCRGEWQLPPGRSLLLPQKPYLPRMSLRGLLAYPQVEVVDDRLWPHPDTRYPAGTPTPAPSSTAADPPEYRCSGRNCRSARWG